MNKSPSEVTPGKKAPARGSSSTSLPRLAGEWSSLFAPEGRPHMAAVLLEYVQARRWFRAKNRTVRGAQIVDLLSLTGEPLTAASDVLVLLEVSFAAGAPELYAIPLTQTEAAQAATLAREAPHALVAALDDGGGAGRKDRASSGEAPVVVDGLVTGGAATLLARIVRAGAVRPGEVGRLRGHPQLAFGRIAEDVLQSPHVAKMEQTNSTVSFGERVLLKIYRQLTAGANPELEMGLFLDATTEVTPGQRRATPPILGALSYEGADGAVYSLGIVHRYLPNQGDAWSLVQRELREYFQRAAQSPSSSAQLSVGRFETLAETLGRRTGELHLALARGDAADPAFAVEPLTVEDRAVAAARASAMLVEHLKALGARLDRLSTEARASAETLLARDSQERRRIEALLTRFGRDPLKVVKTRIHGDLHLGQVLSHGDDFTIIDFEGEPARPLAERRAKSSPLRDVMGMMRSFSYAPEAVLRADNGLGAAEVLATASARWKSQVKGSYLRGYLATVGDAPFLPASTEPRQLDFMLAFYELERVIYEVGYELNNRTDWVDIPLGGLREIAARSESSADATKERA